MTNKDDNPTNVDAEAETNESPVPLAEWTIMIYMAGDNNLADDCVNALKRLQTVKTGDTIHVIAQFDPADTRFGSQRLVMNLNEKRVRTAVRLPMPASPSKLAKDSVKIEEGTIKFDKGVGASVKGQSDPAETDTADPKTLFDFISWSSEAYKAKRYMLVLAGHSSGIEQGYLMRDEHPAQSMALDGLMRVLRQVKDKLGIKLDILGMDSCLMSMIEICYELSSLDLVDVYVSSQSMTPNPGWPFGEIVEGLMQSKGEVKTDDFAKMIVNRYVNSYVENAVSSGLATDQAALKVAGSGELAGAIKTLGSVMREKLGDGSGADFNRALIHAHWEAQSYNSEQFVDLRDFCDLAQRYCNDAAVSEAVRGVREKMDKMMLAACFCGIDYQYSNGLSIYFPWSTIFSYYQNLAFAKDTGADWFQFLSDYVEKTRREPRGGNAPGPSKRFIVFRRDPPYGHGPGLAATSMRNPPRKWSRNGISDCIENKPQWSELFDSSFR